jgi:hypothetical protein
MATGHRLAAQQGITSDQNQFLLNSWREVLWIMNDSFDIRHYAHTFQDDRDLSGCCNG